MSTFTLDGPTQETASKMVSELSDTIADICNVMVHQHNVPEDVAALVAVDVGLTASLYGWAALHMASDTPIGDKAAWLEACEKAFDDELPTLLFGQFVDAARPRQR